MVLSIHKVRDVVCGVREALAVVDRVVETRSDDSKRVEDQFIETDQNDAGLEGMEVVGDLVSLFGVAPLMAVLVGHLTRKPPFLSSRTSHRCKRLTTLVTLKGTIWHIHHAAS